MTIEEIFAGTEAEALAARAPVRPDSPTFAELGVRPETVAALDAVGITRAFAIQEYAVPIALRGADLIGQAPTGTGKTLGFGIPILESVIAPAEGASGRPQALVVVPTRELGLQVARDIAAAGSTRGVRVLPVYGGVAYEPQTGALTRGVEVVVGTPGRLLDLAKGRQLRFDAVRTLVLDEADRMLDLGFLDDVEKILAMLPAQRQTMLFSATMPDPISTLARRFLHQPVTVRASHDATTGPSPHTTQVVYRTHSLNKVEVVARILQATDRGLTMIFTRTKRAADRLSEDLDFRGFAVGAVHGDLGQGARERALRAFRTGKVDILVATDVAARGLDVTGVTHVINYDCPEDADTYVHRIGRTGRAGATGVAVTFVDWEDLPRWRLIDKTLQLELTEPAETYHTSAWLYTDLGIPDGVGATLPTGDRVRAGLGAEVLEDVEGKAGRGARGRTRSRRGGGAASGGAASGGPAGGGAASGGAAGAAGGAPAAEATQRPRRRRRRRLDDDAVGTTDAGSRDGSRDSTGSAGTPDSTGARDATGSSPAAPSTAAAPLTPDFTPPAAGAAPGTAPRRRRRRRSGSGTSEQAAAEQPDTA